MRRTRCKSKKEQSWARLCAARLLASGAKPWTATSLGRRCTIRALTRARGQARHHHAHIRIDRDRKLVSESGRPVIEKPFLPSEVRRIVAQLSISDGDAAA
jgi:hypothetical protein